MNKEEWRRIKSLGVNKTPAPDKNSKHVGNFRGKMNAFRGRTPKSGRVTKSDGLTNHERVSRGRANRWKRIVDAVNPFI